jgi:hypothetical protein
MGSDTFASLGLGVERPARQIMNWPLAFHAYLFLGLIEAAAGRAIITT